MKDYQIVRGQGAKPSEAIEGLEKAVQRALKKGWEPQGGLCVTIEEEEYCSKWFKWYIACQAMIKNE